MRSVNDNPTGRPATVRPAALAEVRLHEDAKREGSRWRLDDARGGPDAALEAEEHHAGPATHAALGDRTRRGAIERGPDIFLAHGEGQVVVQEAVVALGHDGNGDLVAREVGIGAGEVARDAVHDDADAAGPGQRDRRVHEAALVDHAAAGDLAVAVERRDARVDALLNWVAIVGPDRRDAGADVLALDARGVANTHARHVGDRVQGACG